MRDIITHPDDRDMPRTALPPAASSTGSLAAFARRVIPRLTLILSITSIATSIFFWQIYYFVLRTNYLHPLVSMDAAQVFACVLPFLPHLLTGCLVILTLSPLGRDVRFGRWRVVASLLLPLTIPITAVIYNGFDPAWGTRSYSPHLKFADRIAGGFSNHSAHPEYARTEDFNGNFGTFTDLAADLPPAAATSPHASEIILAIDTIELRDTGVVLGRGQHWVYFGHSRAVAFADGHADLVLISRLSAALARSNAHRAAFGLPAVPLPPGRPPP